MGLLSIIVGAVGAIASAAMTVTKALAVAGLAIQGLKAIGNVLTKLGQALGLIKPETKVDELGDRALQAEENGIKPEDFDSYADYFKTIEEYPLDPEKSKLIPEEDKIKKGMELASGMMIENYQDFPMQEFLISAGKNGDFFTENKMSEIGKLILEDSGNIEGILHFVDGTEKNDAKLNGIIDKLVNVEKTVNPDMSDKDALKAVLSVRGK